MNRRIGSGVLLLVSGLLGIQAQAQSPSTGPVPQVRSASDGTLEPSRRLRSGLVGAAQASPANAPLPGGLADATGRRGFVASAVGGIEAIDLITGHVLWASIEAQVPLLAANDRLYAQAGTKRNRLRVLVYDLNRTGEVVLESDPVVFPDWVVTGVAPGHSFKADWKLQHDVLMLAWQAETWYHGKDKPTPQAQAHKQAEGRVRIDLVGGKVQHLPAEPVAVTIGPSVPVKDLEKKEIRWQGVIRGQYKAVVLQTEKEQEKLLLLSWDRSGSALLPSELIRASKVTLMPTLDERMVCVREVQPSPDRKIPIADRDRFAWTLYDLDTADVVARITFEPSTQAMVVIGSRLFVMQAGPIVGALHETVQSSRILKAIDLKSGKPLWQHPIAGKAHHPPAR